MEISLKQSPVVVVQGLRQTGKSTLLQLDPVVHPSRRYYTLDDLDNIEIAQSRPRELLASASQISLDEVQRVPELLLTLKRLVDESRQPGRFVLTGSANFLLMKQVADSLAGRAVYATLHPMSRREILGQLGQIPALMNFIDKGEWLQISAPPLTDTEVLRGGFPELALNPQVDSGLWFDGFEKAYLERDVRDLRRVEDLIGFRRLLHLTALRVGSVLNVNGLARDAHMPEATVRRHLDLLETLMVIRRIYPFLGNRSSRLIKAPKLYFADTGLAAYLAGINSIHASSSEPLRGALIENYVLQNLLASLEPYLPRMHLYYWNEQGRYEVDFVLETGRTVIAIEIKSSARLESGQWRGLEAFQARTPSCQAALLAHLGHEIHPLGHRLWAVPIPILLN